MSFLQYFSGTLTYTDTKTVVILKFSYIFIFIFYTMISSLKQTQA